MLRVRKPCACRGTACGPAIAYAATGNSFALLRWGQGARMLAGIFDGVVR
jgi:hypothetical protein